jgi:hypothetical protein
MAMSGLKPRGKGNWQNQNYAWVMTIKVIWETVVLNGSLSPLMRDTTMESKVAARDTVVM